MTYYVLRCSPRSGRLGLVRGAFSGREYDFGGEHLAACTKDENRFVRYTDPADAEKEAARLNKVCCNYTFTVAECNYPDEKAGDNYAES